MHNKQVEMKPVKAYIGFTRGAGIISTLIRRLDGGFYNHVYWRFDFEPTGSLIYESHINGGVQITPYSHLESAKEKGSVLAVKEFDLGLTAKQCEFLWADCLPEHGDHYNAMQIVRYYFWIRLSKRKAVQWVDKQSDRYTCNQFVVKTGRKVVDAMSALDYTFTIKPLYELAERCFKPVVDKKEKRNGKS